MPCDGKPGTSARTGSKTDFAGDFPGQKKKEDSKATAQSNDELMSKIMALAGSNRPLNRVEKEVSSRRIVMAVIDYMYASATKDLAAPKSVSIVAHDAHGLGDLFFAIKIADILTGRFPAMPISVDWISPDTRAEKYERAKPLNRKFAIERQKSFAPNSPRYNKKILLVCPTLDCGKLADGKKDLEDVIYMTEYEAARRKDISLDTAPVGTRFIQTGITDNAFGMVFDTMQPGSLDSVNKVMGKFPVTAGKYHFMYVNSAHAKGLAILKTQNGGKLPADMIIAGGTDQEKSLLAALPALAGDAQKIEFINVQSNKTETFGSGDTFCRIRFAAFVNEDFRAALRHSARVCFATGDQSVSEALSRADPFVFYEQLPHKRAFAAQLSSIPKLPFKNFTNSTDVAKAAGAPASVPDGSAGLATLRQNHAINTRIIGAVAALQRRRTIAGAYDLERELFGLSVNFDKLALAYEKLQMLQKLIRS